MRSAWNRILPPPLWCPAGPAAAARAFPQGYRQELATCVVSLVDRLVHHAEIIAIEGESYRLKEAQERSDQRARQSRKAKS